MEAVWMKKPYKNWKSFFRSIFVLQKALKSRSGIGFSTLFAEFYLSFFLKTERIQNTIILPFIFNILF
jgi:hypothetical protein